ncbi:MAG: UDP-N-acetylmuramoyl-L-alanyl-D-glutamate--2,6-diaminopimelate ligase, partial [Bacteroidales bacterium]|nr:UDP-N-acetylmuramoyl-L-alanyl-D-glutamate--2,6-diaminopimelate ligase [Bacteroidales bacterium]
DQVPGEVAVILSDSSSRMLGEIASAYYDHPSRQLKLCGVTGTNGKTTIVSLLHKLFRELGYPAGLLSTIENRINDNILEATHTTPDAPSINKMLRKMVDEGCSHAFMEVSSHAIEQNRISGIRFKSGVFTNITHEHLDYHNTFKDYITAKKKFFDALPKDAFALTNMDDRNGLVMLQNTRATKKTYSLKRGSDYKARILENRIDGMLLKLGGHEVWCKLPGVFNAYNLLAIYGTALLLGIGEQDVLTQISNLNGAKGRFEIVRGHNNISGIVDYAHTPDALNNVLQTISGLRKANQQLITVVGAGGDRDKKKRPLMGSIALQYSNRVILTSDNPRTESPAEIIEDMKRDLKPEELKRILEIENRKEAIKTACMLSREGDIILVAGKGHEKYQVIGKEKLPFDDKAILIEVLTGEKQS